MLLFFSLLGLFLSLLLMWYNAGKHGATCCLGGFFLLLSLYVFVQWGFLYSGSWRIVQGLLMVLAFVVSPLYLIGPLLYWYVRNVLGDYHGLRRTDWLHLLPMLIYFAAALPYTLMVPLQEKAETARQVVANVGIMQGYAATPLSHLFSVMDVYLSRPVLVLLYAIWSGMLITRYWWGNHLKRVISGQRFMLRWLVLLTSLVVLTSLTHAVLIADTFRSNFSEFSFGLNAVRVISTLGLGGLLLSPFFFPAILYGLPRVPSDPPAGSRPRPPRRELHHYQKDYLRDMGRRVDSYMQEHQPYLQPQFNISQMAVQLQVPVHHLGYYFREEKKQTFSEYRNRWRVEHAKRLIREGQNQQLTLEAIAALSGFANRNAFRSVFLKTEGICPATFARGQAADRDNSMGR